MPVGQSRQRLCPTQLALYKHAMTHTTPPAFVAPSPSKARLSQSALWLACAALLPLGAAQANPSSPEELARASGCMSCHSAAEKVVGPSFKSIAEKYKGQADAVASLSQSVRNGSRGNWGRIPMPPHASLADADIKQLVTWVVKH